MVNAATPFVVNDNRIDIICHILDENWYCVVSVGGGGA